MTLTILTLVLGAALLDALQHGLIKSQVDPLARALAVAMAGGLIAGPLLAFTGLPGPAALPWLALSVVLGTLYWILLGHAYLNGALAVVFALSRGGGVVLTALGGHFLIADPLTRPETLVLAAILCGLALVCVGLRPLGGLRVGWLMPTLGLAVVIGAFTLVDAMGVRSAGAALPYCLALYLGNALGVGVYVLTAHADRFARLPWQSLPGIAACAALSLAAYGLILIGFRHAPVALVAAIAETSIVFAALLGLFWLREPARLSQSVGVMVIAAGVAFLRLGT